MVFTSIPLYLDTPLLNWQQQNNQLGDGNPQLQQHHQQPTEQRQSIQQPLPPPAPAATSIRPGSMADRARVAKIPQPEAALKCPRCDSTNTKFCYFNNYSLSQPRHFCKTCRRYWTRGGAMRNVPVGGGCRRNKRSKGSSSAKSPASSSGQRSSTTPVEAGSAGQLPPQPQLHLPFMAGDQYSAAHHLCDQYSAAHHDHVGLSYGGIQAASGGTDNNMEFHMGAGPSTGSVGSIDQQWRLPPQTQQFPLLAGLEAPHSVYPFEGEAANSDQMNMGGRAPSSSGLITQMAPVKMEDSHVGLNMHRNFLCLPGQDQYWGGGNAWSTTDLTGFSSSSTSHML